MMPRFLRVLPALLLAQSVSAAVVSKGLPSSKPAPIPSLPLQVPGQILLPQSLVPAPPDPGARAIMPAASPLIGPNASPEGSKGGPAPAGPEASPLSSLSQMDAWLSDPARQSPEEALRSAFDGASRSGNGKDGGSEPPPGFSASVFLDEQYAKAREALARGKEDIPAALQALEVISWSRPYLDPGDYDAWLERQGRKVKALDKRLAEVVKRGVYAEIHEDDAAGARERLEELAQRHPAWARDHDAVLEPLRRALPAEGAKAEPHLPAGEPERLAELLKGHLGKGEFRQAEYLAALLAKKHPEWAASGAGRGQLEAARQAVLQGVYESFDARKSAVSPIEARRLVEYARAAAEGRNLGFGFKQPLKQDPLSLMCTVMSICNAFEATIGFADPAMDLAKFTELVRTILKEPTLGTKKGLSTHRVRTLMHALGFKLRVIEMQERLRRPFQEEELVRLIRPGQVVLPVFIIVQKYPDEAGLLREEHKGFLRDAYFSAAEKKWVYLMMDPLIGRMSFYSFAELKVFLHRLFVIKTDKPLAAPSRDLPWGDPEL